MIGREKKKALISGIRNAKCDVSDSLNVKG